MYAAVPRIMPACVMASDNVGDIVGLAGVIDGGVDGDGTLEIGAFDQYHHEGIPLNSVDGLMLG
jgi:hypothetical protein